jgi:hypothetical protein
MPLDSFTNEWVVSQILVRCMNTVHMSVVIYDAFRFLLCHIVALRSINYHTHDFTYERFFIDCSQRQYTLPLSIRINTGSLYRNVSIQNYKRDKDNVS